MQSPSFKLAIQKDYANESGHQDVVVFEDDVDGLVQDRVFVVVAEAGEVVALSHQVVWTSSFEINL